MIFACRRPCSVCRALQLYGEFYLTRPISATTGLIVQTRQVDCDLGTLKVTRNRVVNFSLLR